MGQNLEQFHLTEKVKISYLVNRGNIIAIAEEMKLPIDYIKKLVNKFKKQESRNVSVLISNNIMEYIFMGYKARTHNLTEMWKALLGRDKSLISVCCEKPVRKIEGSENYQCLSCNLPCAVELVDEEGIIELKMGLLEQLREEDKALVDFADRMGYTNKPQPESPLVGTLNHNILVLGEGEDKKIVEDYKNLPPMDRQRIIDTIDANLLKKENQDEENKNSD